MADTEKTFAEDLQKRLVDVEKRDKALWVLVLVVVSLLSIGFFIIFIPAVLYGEERIRFEGDFSPQLLLAFFLLIVAFILYTVRKQMENRELRIKSVIDAWNFAVAHTQLLVDPLTRVFNRSALEDILAKELMRVKRNQSNLVFHYIDVNNFKSVNTRFGHIAGDLLLAEVGAILKGCLRGSDYVIRLGGDEFLIALPDTDLAGAQIVKDRIRKSEVEWNLKSSLKGFTLGLSIGTEEFDGTKSLEEILAQADAKMYEEKAKVKSA